MSQRESKGVRRPNNSVRSLKRGLIVNGLVQGIGPCTLETNWEIAQFRVSPAPDQSPAPEVRLRKSGSGSPASPG